MPNGGVPKMSRFLSVRLLLSFAWVCMLGTQAFAKDACLGDVQVTLKSTDGTETVLHEGLGWSYMSWDTSVYINVSLGEGDTILLEAIKLPGPCMSYHLGLWIQGDLPGDTATFDSPVINLPYANNAYGKIFQPGSYLIQATMEWSSKVHLFVSGEVKAVPVDLNFTKSWSQLLSTVASGDTCFTPCITAYLTTTSVTMRPMVDHIFQPGGRALVRYAPEGDTVTFDTPATVVEMDGYGGYSFDADGLYLITVEDSLFINPGYAFVRVSHLPPPRVDMAVWVERADGTVDSVVYSQPDQIPIKSVYLEPGDSLRIDHLAITEPCPSVRLEAYKNDDWSSPNASWSPLVMDTASSVDGVRVAEPGVYLFRVVPQCNVPGSKAQVSIYTPDHHVDLNLSVVRAGGTEEVIYDEPMPINPPMHLTAITGPGDSIRASYVTTEWCGNPTMRIYRAVGTSSPENSTVIFSSSDTTESTFSGAGRYLVKVSAAPCISGAHSVYVDLQEPPGIGLVFERVRGTMPPDVLLTANAASPVAITDVFLAPEDSIRVLPLGLDEPCTGLSLHIHHSDADTVTAQDPLFLSSTFNNTGIVFRQTGRLLFLLEDSCQALTGTAILDVIYDLSTGLISSTGPASTFTYCPGLLTVHPATDGVLELRNSLGQLISSVELSGPGTTVVLPIPHGSHGMYLAVLRGSTQQESFRFVVE